MWTCTLELVDDCAGGGMFDAPTSYRGQDACPACVDAVGPGADPETDVPATTAYGVTD